MEATMYFKRSRGQNYMMRSEKRPGYPNAPRRQKPPKRSFWYQLVTILLLIFLCPVGLILLWRKKLTWPNPVKLLATLLSIVMLFLMIGGALWYPFKDARLRNAQQTVANAISRLSDAAEEIPENWNAFMENGLQIGAVAGDQALGKILEVIASPTPEPTQMPPMALVPGKGSQETVVELLNKPTPSPTPTPTVEPTETPEPTMEPTETPDASANVLERPTPSQDPMATQNPSAAANASATPVPPVTPTPTPTPTAPPTPKPTATPEPTIDPALIPELVPAGEKLMVWYTSNGQWYHKGSTCGTMSGAKQHSLASAVAKGKTACPYCNPIEETWGQEDNPAVFVATDSFWHINPDCESCTKNWTPMLLYEAITDRSVAPCDACGAMFYLNGIPELTSADVPKTDTASENVLAATATVKPAAPTPSLAPGETPRPTPIDDGLNLANVKNGDEVVYYSANTSHYHRRSMCASATTSTFMPGKLIDALLENKVACPVCEPPEPMT